MAAVTLPRAVRRALDHIEAEPARPHSLADLARAAGVASRTLQKQFRRALGKTPHAAIRDARLARARQELLRGRTDASVTDIAVSCGFGHFGRFAADYRACFGETPSATLRRQRAFAPPAPKVLGPGPERPALAVLPFDAIGSDGRLARSLAEEIVTAMARLRSVILTREAAARYHLHGAVRERGRTARVTLRLVDAPTGRLLWADRQDGTVDDLFGFEERVAVAVCRAIEPNVRAAEIARVRGKDPAALTAYELTMRALPAAMALEPAADAAALELLERAMELAPDDPRPVALAAWCHAQRAAHHFTDSPAHAKATALRLAERAGRLQSGDALALTVLSGAYTLLHDLATADTLIEWALRLDSSLAWAWGRSAWIRCYRGEAAEAFERFQLALDLAPDDPLTFLNHLGLAASLFSEARYDASARWFARAIAEHPQALWANRFLAPAYALSGRRDEARKSRAVLLKAFPDLTIAQVKTGLPFTRNHLERVVEGLEDAGMPRG